MGADTCCRLDVQNDDGELYALTAKVRLRGTHSLGDVLYSLA
jgi:hypothetical protein